MSGVCREDDGREWSCEAWGSWKALFGSLSGKRGTELMSTAAERPIFDQRGQTKTAKWECNFYSTKIQSRSIDFRHQLTKPHCPREFPRRRSGRRKSRRVRALQYPPISKPAMRPSFVPYSTWYLFCRIVSQLLLRTQIPPLRILSLRYAGAFTTTLALWM